MVVAPAMRKIIRSGITSPFLQLFLAIGLFGAPAQSMVLNDCSEDMASLYMGDGNSEDGIGRQVDTANRIAEFRVKVPEDRRQSIRDTILRLRYADWERTSIAELEVVDDLKVLRAVVFGFNPNTPDSAVNVFEGIVPFIPQSGINTIPVKVNGVIVTVPHRHILEIRISRKP